jgi:hypothetical protein
MNYDIWYDRLEFNWIEIYYYEYKYAFYSFLSSQRPPDRVHAASNTSVSFLFSPPSRRLTRFTLGGSWPTWPTWPSLPCWRAFFLLTAAAWHGPHCIVLDGCLDLHPAAAWHGTHWGVLGRLGCLHLAGGLYFPLQDVVEVVDAAEDAEWIHVSNLFF